jgi:hypothetical protein
MNRLCKVGYMRKSKGQTSRFREAAPSIKMGLREGGSD